jgi:hypothetical protein
MTEPEFFAKTLMVSRLMLAVSILVSVITIVFGSLTMAFQRSHNRKSVKPLCNIHTFFSDGVLHLSIYNAGLGPMIVSGTGLMKPGGNVRKDLLPVESVIPEGIACITDMALAGEYIIPPVSERKVLEFRAAGDNTSLNKLKDIFEEYRLVIKFYDLYDRKYKRIVRLDIF